MHHSRRTAIILTVGLLLTGILAGWVQGRPAGQEMAPLETPAPQTNTKTREGHPYHTPGTAVQSTAVANTGYSFATWRGDASKTVTANSSSGVPFVAISSGNGFDDEPALARASNSALIAAWHNSDGYIYEAISSDQGSSWAPASKIGVGLRPVLLTAQDGRLWLVYDHNNDIWYRTSSDNGSTWSAELRATSDPGDDFDSTVGQTQDGALWLVWTSSRQAGGATIWFKRSTNNGVSWSADAAIPMTPAWRLDPTIAQMPDGRVWVAWFDTYEIKYSLTSDNGATWSGLLSMNLYPAGAPRLSVASDGKAWMVWSLIYYDHGAWRSHLQYRTSIDSESSWGAPQRFTVFNGENTQPMPAPLLGGGMAFAWRSNRTGAVNIWFGIPGTHGDTVIPPSILSPAHYPTLPGSSTVVSFTVNVADVTAVSSAELLLTVNGASQQARPMYDNGQNGDGTSGDSTYTALTGPFAAGATVVYQVRATNGKGLSALTPPDRSFNIPPRKVFLPLMLNGWPPLPAAPILSSITPPEDNPSYTVSWTTAVRADRYVLERATGPSFGDAVQVYSGTVTSYQAASVGIATYCYRVKAANAWGDSAWSNGQPVEVRWEREPNDQISQMESRSRLLFSKQHYGAMSSDRDVDPAIDQGRDYFYFDVDAPRIVELWLQDIPAGSNYDLYVRPDWDLQQIIGFSVKEGNADERVRLDALPAGHRYFVQVYNRDRVRSTQPYSLTLK